MLPMWNNSDEYNCFNSPEFKKDIELIESGIQKINTLGQELSKSLSETDQPISESLLQSTHKILALRMDVYTLMGNISTFTHCEQALDAKNKEAKKISSQIENLVTRFETAFNPWNLFILKTTDENFKKIMNSENSKDYSFYFSHQRKLKYTLLSNAEENILTQLKVSGHLSWGNLYNSISGTAPVEMHTDTGVETVSIAVASGLTKNKNEKTREAAWKGLQKTWSDHKQSVAEILNALAGWRLDVNELRSKEQKQSFLSQPLHNNRITEETLNAMVNAIIEFKPQIQLGAKTMAKHLGKSKLDPWDLLAPAPIEGAPLSFENSFEKVKNSFTAVDPKMGEFAQMMLDKNWIDASVRPNKRNGAFCTGFSKSRTPRIFQTFTGSALDTSTMAHELGHAYHSWVMRDMNLAASRYPMSLAETASIFAENVLFDHEIETAKTKDDLLAVYWATTEQAVSLLLNICTRFEFEKNFYQKRKEGYVGADELSDLTAKAYDAWYGDSLSEPDRMFWATKLHFSMAHISFYNFPYTFGYLFSFSLYARKEEWGKDFSQKYISILRDTGTMTAEDLIQKHLGEDITKVEFWRKSLSAISNKIIKFSQMDV